MNSPVLRICLIEDDALMGEAVSERFEMEGLDHDWHTRGKDALLALQHKRYSVVVSDIRLPDLNGEDVFLQLREEQAEAPPFIFMTAYGNIDQAVRLLRLGAADYVTKPLDLSALVQRVRELGSPPGTPVPAGVTLGVSPAMRRIEGTLCRLASAEGNVLITGESGVGKERVAQRLHELSRRGAARPLVAVNCGAIPENLLEAELFGYEKGAFTGAAKERRGYFEQADGGTLFLDEIGDMPLTMQVKLLRALQDRTITRVGGETPTRVDVRLICATHEDLRQLVESARFREDLYYRVNVVHLRIPPLRERREDILWLAHRFLEEQSAKKRGAPFSFSAAAERAMLAYPWPGNIRELKHCIERACILAERAQLGPEMLVHESGRTKHETANTGDKLITHLDACERRYIEQMLTSCGGRVGDAAEALGISRKNLWEKMRKHGIVRMPGSAETH